jgi:ubiquinone/menaquinone biosynthesis C-methylase UbiE
MDTVTQLTYQALQQGTAALSIVHKQLANQVAQIVAPLRQTAAQDATRPTPQPLPEGVLMQVNARREKLHEIDLQEADRGIYPASLLFDRPWLEAIATYPRIWIDLPGTWDRRDRKAYQEFASDIDTAGYPKYYLQNFHYQTDGYLSDASADLYDLQVEILFSGSADAMRRRILAPIKAGIDRLTANHPTIPQQVRILDLATGTGRTLRFLRGMLPKAQLFGVDLSPAYLRKANTLLAERSGELPQLCQANIEALPYCDAYFHAVSCVFSLHELPGEARQNAIASAYRVLKPGGTFVICDSIQQGDVPIMDVMLDNFPIVFHEPYHGDYARDDIEGRLEVAGFEVIETYDYFASKYWVARKPDAAEAVDASTH